jgi:hypothetical protein
MTMRGRALALGIIALCAVGCAKAPAADDGAEKPELTPELQALVLEEAPSDIATPLYVDFNAKAELLGYSLDAQPIAAPGSKLSLKLYFRSSGQLDEGYVPFTELVLPDGKRIEIVGNGPLRKGALTPSHWEHGKVYVDQMDLTVPPELDAARFSIVVGFKTQPIAVEEPEKTAEEVKQALIAKAQKKPNTLDEAKSSFGEVYLSVLSGPSDDKHGAVLTTLETGVKPGARARAAKDDKRAPGALKRAPGGAKQPSSAKPRPATSAQ